MKVEEIGIDFPVLCQLCKERFCTHCPEGAIQIGELGQILVNVTLCNGCGLCEHACPIGAIELYKETPYVCDLCGGDPGCVKECNLGALLFEPEKRDTVSLKTLAKRNKALSPDEKRLNFVVSKAAHLRKQWTLSRRT
jgi:carbon-monoxide dehydrogenase iron sulfur subunit